MEEKKSIWDLDEFKPIKRKFILRNQELQKRKSYYDGSVYKDFRVTLGTLAPRLFNGIKSLYLPLAFAVDMDCGLVPGGWKLNNEKYDLEAESILIDKIKSNSDWITSGVLYIHYASMYGQVFLKSIDGDEPRLEIIEPTKVMLLKSDVYRKDFNKSIFVSYDEEDNEIAEVIDTFTIRTFLNGELTSENENVYHKIPYNMVKFIEDGTSHGENTFQKVTQILDEVNELASYLVTIIKRHAEPQLVLFGNFDSESLNKSGENAWLVKDANGKAELLVSNVDIDGILNTVKTFSQNINDGLPETIFNRISESENIGKGTVVKKATPLVVKINRCRPNFDMGLVKSLRLIGEMFDETEYSILKELPDDTFDLNREIIPSTEIEKIELESAQLALEQQRALSAGG